MNNRVGLQRTIFVFVGLRSSSYNAPNLNSYE